jgi:hypothetical protein
MKFQWIKIASVLICFSISVSANIQLIKKENTDSNTTLLVIAGVHGNEPGSYFAASILATHYEITSKNLWIVPNLNQKSIQKNRRGIYGDMNRKFSVLKKDDKDIKTIHEIKKIILEKKVSLVLNLHDGHGFYRKENHGKIFNPNAWGQTCVIDQCTLNVDQPYGNLNSIALDVKERMNKKLLKEHHSFDIRNTNTKFDDEAMQLSLTYFAVTNNKPAFAIESSKSLSSLSQKVYYQLLAMEEFMNIMGISFTRKFELSEKHIGKILNNYGNLRINNNFTLDLFNIKKSLSFIPLRLKNNVFKFSNPLGSIVKRSGVFTAYVGNRKVLTLKPQYFQIAKTCTEKFDVIIDGDIVSLNETSDIIVNDDFNIVKKNDFRVNVIGYTSKKRHSESGVSIRLKDLNKRFSLDKANKVYRVEFYKNNEFCSMSKVHFK